MLKNRSRMASTGLGMPWVGDNSMSCSAFFLEECSVLFHGFQKGVFWPGLLCRKLWLHTVRGEFRETQIFPAIAEESAYNGRSGPCVFVVLVVLCRAMSVHSDDQESHGDVSGWLGIRKTMKSDEIRIQNRW